MLKPIHLTNHNKHDVKEIYAWKSTYLYPFHTLPMMLNGDFNIDLQRNNRTFH